MLSVYGTGLTGQLTYDVWVGLWLNRNRVAHRRAAEMAMAIGLAMGEKPEKSFFDSMADDAEEAAEAEKLFEANTREQAAINRIKNR